MSRRQISRIYPGTLHINRKEENWFKKILKKNNRCQACGAKNNLQPHHIIPCHVYDKLYFDVENGAVLCQSCHDRYHQTCFPINEKTFREFCLKKHSPKSKRTSKKRYKRRKYESSPLYSKIRINDFTKKSKPKKNKRKRKKSKKRKRKRRFKPLFLTKEWGSDNWEYEQRIELEKEVLGDYL